MWPDGSQPGLGEQGGRASTGSEVVTIDDRAVAAAREVPSISNLNVTRSSRVHVGPKFVSVTQNVHNTEVIKGRFLGLELVSPKANRLRCSIAVFVCWAIVVASGLAIYLVYFAIPKLQTRLDIGLNESWYLRRADWQALDPFKEEFLQLPVKYVIVGHSGTPYCDEKYDCINKVMLIQNEHFKRRFVDIGPNFLVGGKGWVFEGRGANVEAAMVLSWNKYMIGIMFLGDYRRNTLDEEQLEHFSELLRTLVRRGVLRPEYKLYGYCQIYTLNISPGPNIMEKLKTFPHWQSENASLCLKT